MRRNHISRLFLGYLTASLFLAVGLLCAQQKVCPELDGLSTEVELQFLKQGRATPDPTCVARALYDISLARGLSEHVFSDAVLTLLTYLDYRLPDQGTKYERAVSSNRDPYPASSALFIVGKRAVPYIVELIGKGQAASEVSIRNALDTLGAIYREDPPQAVRVLKSAADINARDFQKAERLRKAARDVTFCHGSVRQACIDAFYE